MTLALAACGPASKPAVGAPSRSEEAAKRVALAETTTYCDLEAIKARPLPAPGADAPPPPPRPAATPFEPQVFLEIAAFVLPTAKVGELRGSHAALARDPDVSFLGVPHVSAPLDRPARVELEEHTGPLARPSLREISAKVLPANEGKHVVELAFTLQLPAGPSAPLPIVPPERQVRFVTSPVEASAVVLDAAIPSFPGRSLLAVVTLYPVREEADLRALFVCKLERRRAVGASHGSTAPRAAAELTEHRRETPR